MEVGAVIGAVKKSHVVRKTPQKGDIVLLIGGRTGRDGVGGATGSSVAQDENALATAGAQVQKGNPIIERKLQRLFRNPEATKLIIRCNDFGAGGVSVAIGEIADSIEINLDNVRKKYEGLDGTELAISESQERMAVVTHAQDAAALIQLAKEENLEAYQVAEITDTGRLVMKWRGTKIVDISREFLNSAGVRQKASVCVASPQLADISKKPTTWLDNLKDLNVAGQIGLGEHFDSTVGAGSVLAPFGGKYQLTPAQVMAAQIPVLGRQAATASLMSFGFDPYISEQSPYHGAVYAVVESVARLVAAGADYSKVRLSFQEYFEKMTDAKSWGKPFAAILGAFSAQMALKIPAIGGKDSMSGTYQGRYHVPPTLVSFSVATARSCDIISPEFKRAKNTIALLKTPMNSNNLPDFEKLKRNFELLNKLILEKKVISARVVGFGGLAAAICEMSFGNKIGVNIEYDGCYFSKQAAAFVVEIDGPLPDGLEKFGTTTDEPILRINGEEIAIDDCIAAWLAPLEEVFPTGITLEKAAPLELPKPFAAKNIMTAKEKFAKPRVFLPVFPGTNCEWDMAAAFEKAGASTEIFVLNNLTHELFIESVAKMVKHIDKAQIIALSGGFSAGDEPDGCGKFIAAVFSNPAIAEATMKLLNEREGLMIGICNGFQALVKTGLLPYGKIAPLTTDSPTLTYNAIGRHISNMAQTKIMSNKSPWLAKAELGGIYRSPTSHGQGRFVAKPSLTAQLFDNGQVITVFVDHDGNPAEGLPYNPNGSYMGIEGITDPTGRILGKMGHSERGAYKRGVLYKNIPGNFDQKIFESGVAYFK
jgi:phosphoribosylformylglycinamidine synthase